MKKYNSQLQKIIFILLPIHLSGVVSPYKILNINRCFIGFLTSFLNLKPENRRQYIINITLAATIFFNEKLTLGFLIFINSQKHFRITKRKIYLTYITILPAIVLSQYYTHP